MVRPVAAAIRRISALATHAPATTASRTLQSQATRSARRQRHPAAAKCPRRSPRSASSWSGAIRWRSRSPSTLPAGRSTSTRSKCSRRKACTRDGSWMRWVTRSCSRRSRGWQTAQPFRIGVAPSISRIGATGYASACATTSSISSCCTRTSPDAACAKTCCATCDCRRSNSAIIGCCTTWCCAWPAGSCPSTRVAGKCSVAASCTCRARCAGT